MVKQIPLTGKYGAGKFALVDDDLYEYLNQWKWNFNARYVVRSVYDKQTKKTFVVFLHRLVMNPPLGLVVDHIDHDPLHNTRSNLRLATVKQNSRNRLPEQSTSSRYKGVHYRSHLRRWRATIGVNQRTVELGNYDSEEDAARAYNAAAVRYFGEYAHLNEISTEDRSTVDIKPRRQPRSKLKGIYLDKSSGMWRSRIYTNNQRVHLGLYGSEEEAARAYDAYVIEHGLGHPLNFPD